MAQFILVAFVGVWLSKRSYLDHQTISKTGGMNFQALMPSLVFTATVGAISIDQLGWLWPLPVFAVIVVAQGYILSILIGRMLGLEAELLYYVAQCSAYGNTGYLAWLLLPAIITASSQFPNTSEAIAASVSYVSIYTCALMVLILTTPYMFVPASIKLPPAQLNSLDNHPASVAGDIGEISSLAAMEETVASSNSEHSSSEGAVIVQLAMTEPDLALDSIQSTPPVSEPAKHAALADGAIADQTCGREITHKPLASGVHALAKQSSIKRISSALSRNESLQRAARTFRKAAQHPLFNMPMLACVAGVVVGAVTPLKTVFVEPGKPLNWFYLAAKYMGAASSPLAMLILGAEAVQTGKQQSSLQFGRSEWYRALAVATLVKLIISPVITVLLTSPSALGFLLPASDPVFRLVILIESAVPGATSLVVIGMSAVKDVVPFSKIIFWQHIIALGTLAGFSVWFLSIVSA